MKWVGLLLVMLCIVLQPVYPQAADQIVAEAGEGNPVTIAAIFSQTGIGALHNRPLIEMIELTVDQLNSDGGVLDRKIKLLLLDNQSTPLGAFEAATEAIEAQVTAVIGAHWSSHSIAMAPLLQEARIPMITPASTNPAVTVGRDYVFRTCFIDSMQGMAMARFALQELKVKTAAVLRNIDEEYSRALGGYFADAFSGFGGNIVLDASYRGNATDFSAIIEELLAQQPEAIYIPGYTRDTALFMKQARKLGITATFLGGDGWDMLDRMVPESVEGSYQSVLWHPDAPYMESTVVQKLYEESREVKINNLSTPLAYDAVMLLIDAIRRAGVDDPEKIRDALADTQNFPGATGPISFNGDGDPVDKDVYIVKYVHGERVFTTTVKP